MSDQHTDPDITALRVAIVPAGAVGAYVGGRLTQAGVQVQMLARGAQLAALQTQGLAMESVDGDFSLPPTGFSATADAADAVRASDLVLFAPKSYDTEAVARALLPGLGPDAVVVSLQNGIDNEPLLAEILGPQRVAAGAIYIEVEQVGPGRLIHRRLHRLSIAEQTMAGTPVPRLAELQHACEAAGLVFESASDALTLKWSKLIAISALSGWTAASRRKLDAILADPELRTAFAATLQETATVAAADGAQLDPAQTTAGVLALTARLGDMGSSLLFDREHGRPLEVDALNGAVVRKGRELGIATPYNQALYALLRP